MTHPKLVTPPKRALISVSDKSHLLEFAQALVNADYELLSTGGTAKFLRDHQCSVIDVSEYTGFPEIMDGRVKSLHPKIHGAILGRKGTDDAIIAEQNIVYIDLVVVNLYPFKAVTNQADCSESTAIEHIDIGGPSMIRAAAKNHQRVTVVVDPDDYAALIPSLTTGIDLTTRQQLAAKAFAHTADYDHHIAQYFNQHFQPESFPETLRLSATRKQILRYGENPHQQAASYVLQESTEASVINATQHQGKALSYNNIADSDAALNCVKAFASPTCVIVKHANPCGVASASDLIEAYNKAFATDPTSAFGGILAFNHCVDGELASTIVNKQFVEVIVAPEFTPQALQTFAQKPNVRLLSCAKQWVNQKGHHLQQITDGLLYQSADHTDHQDWTVVTQTQPTAQAMNDLKFAWKVAKYVKSNAIVYAKDQQTIGIGAGQMSRIYSARIAHLKATDEGLTVAGSVMASDAFFPFSDAIDEAHKVGIQAIVQPGGSRKDEAVIRAADDYGIAMAFTHMRHFKH